MKFLEQIKDITKTSAALFFPIIGPIIKDLLAGNNIRRVERELLEKVVALDSKINSQIKQTTLYEEVLKMYGLNHYTEKLDDKTIFNLLVSLSNDKTMTTPQKSKIIELLQNLTSEEWKTLVHDINLYKKEISEIVTANSDPGGKFQAIYNLHSKEKKLNISYIKELITEDEIGLLLKNNRTFFIKEEKWEYLISLGLLEVKNYSHISMSLTTNYFVHANYKLNFLLVQSYQSNHKDS